MLDYPGEDMVFIELLKVSISTVSVIIGSQIGTEILKILKKRKKK